jgi:hypothetical protein
MSKLMIGVFLGVFTSAILYEVLSRQCPELTKKLNDMLEEKCDITLETGKTVENNS